MIARLAEREAITISIAGGPSSAALAMALFEVAKNLIGTRPLVKKGGMIDSL
jgi:hypothetical protein